MGLDQSIQIQPVQILHDIVKNAVVGDAKIVELTRVGGTKRGGRLCLTLETAHQMKRLFAVAMTQPIGTNQLQGGRS